MAQLALPCVISILAAGDPPLPSFAAHFISPLSPPLNIAAGQSDPTYGTSYRDLTQNKKGPFFRFINLCGRRGRIPLYGLVMVVFTYLTFLPTLLYYKYYCTSLVCALFRSLLSPLTPPPPNRTRGWMLGSRPCVELCTRCPVLTSVSFDTPSQTSTALTHQTPT